MYDWQAAALVSLGLLHSYKCIHTPLAATTPPQPSGGPLHMSSPQRPLGGFAGLLVPRLPADLLCSFFCPFLSLKVCYVPQLPLNSHLPLSHNDNFRNEFIVNTWNAAAAAKEENGARKTMTYATVQSVAQNASHCCALY